LDRKLKIVFVSPCYNAEKNLKSLIGSIASQNDSRWHHVIIDDISSDNTYETALELTQGDSRFTVIKNTEKKYALFVMKALSIKFYSVIQQEAISYGLHTNGT
jgi:glycosyltransferase involved in cell wall biosynthesis